MVYVQVSELQNETIFNLDRSLRSVIKLNPRAEWPHFASALERDGFTPIFHPRDNPVFIHSRPWDEHLVSYGQSFFVTFPAKAPYELSGRMLLASSYPSLYAPISADYLAANRVVLINTDHEPVYPDDLAWLDSDHATKCSIGPVRLMREQFPDNDDYEDARATLIESGYEVLAEPA
jgi:hypothetical protein